MTYGGIGVCWVVQASSQREPPQTAPRQSDGASGFTDVVFQTFRSVRGMYRLIQSILTTVTLIQSCLQPGLTDLPDAVARRVVQLQAQEAMAHTQASDNMLEMNLRRCSTLHQLADATNCQLEDWHEDRPRLGCPTCLHQKNSGGTDGKGVPVTLVAGNNRAALGVIDASQATKTVRAALLRHRQSSAHRWCVAEERKNRHRSGERSGSLWVGWHMNAFERVIAIADMRDVVSSSIWSGRILGSTTTAATLSPTCYPSFIRFCSSAYATSCTQWML